jgi:hypothetical protein
MCQQQAGNRGDQQTPGRVVSGQQDARPESLEQAAGHRPARDARQPKAHEDHAELDRARDIEDDPGQRDGGKGIARARDHHPEPEPAELGSALYLHVALECLAHLPAPSAAHLPAPSAAHLPAPSV